jgi:hypothetical protein
MVVTCGGQIVAVNLLPLAKECLGHPAEEEAALQLCLSRNLLMQPFSDASYSFQKHLNPVEPLYNLIEHHLNLFRSI